MAMFVTAFDASGHESDQRIMVVAGFISSADDWIEFSKRWKARLAEDGLEYFQIDEFKTWMLNDEPRRRSLLAALVKLIEEYGYRKFGLCLFVKEFENRITKEVKEKWNLNSYVLAGIDCITQSGKWAAQERIGSPLRHVFEDGDIGKGKLSELACRCRYQQPDFSPGKKPRITPTGNLIPVFVPLQAADFLAGEYFMEMERRLEKSLNRRGQRWPYQQFEKMPGEVRIANGEGLEDLQKVFDVALGTEHLKGIGAEHFCSFKEENEI